MSHDTNFALKELNTGLLKKSGRAAREAARVLFEYRPLSKDGMHLVLGEEWDPSRDMTLEEYQEEQRLKREEEQRRRLGIKPPSFYPPGHKLRRKSRKIRKSVRKSRKTLKSRGKLRKSRKTRKSVRKSRNPRKTRKSVRKSRKTKKSKRKY